MNYYPVYAYIGFILLYHIAEWIVVARSGSWKRRPKKDKKDWSVPIIMVLLKLVMVSPVIEHLYFKRAVEYWGYAVGGVFFVLATILRTKGHLDLKRGFTPYVEKLEGQGLVDKGIYRHIRHPHVFGNNVFIHWVPRLPLRILLPCVYVFDYDYYRFTGAYSAGREVLRCPHARLR